jgi:hypothetical protein
MAGTDPAVIEHPSPHRDRIAFGWLLAGIFAAPFAWTLQFMLGSAFSGHACFPKDWPLEDPLWTPLRGLLATIDVLGVLLAIAGLVISALAWSRLRAESGGSPHHLLDAGEGRSRFLAMAGLLSSVLFLVALVFASAELFVAPPCP